MHESEVKTVTVPGVPTNSPAMIAVAAEVPIRVVVSNVGGVPVRLSYASSSLGGITSEASSHFRLIANNDVVLVLAPKQRLYAVGVGAVGVLSVATSDALPLDLRG